MRFANMRLLNQQLVEPQFHHPKEVVSWMGAMQAQDYAMAKWAVGIRLPSATLHTVNEALRKGEILRTHVMRPTWHLVAAEDIRWMLKLTSTRIRGAYESYARGRQMELSPTHFVQSNDLLIKILSGYKSLTKQEIEEEYRTNGLYVNDHRMTYFLASAELDGLICSGVDKGKKATYALLEERVPATKELTKDESLARLARNYFRSHAPATLQDFIWWSGLSATEAKQAIYFLDSELVKEIFDDQQYFIHQSSRMPGKVYDAVQLLPSYDEYLISYKKRTHVLPLEHHSKAFTHNGLFFPVLLHKGHAIGNWNKTIKRGKLCTDPILWVHNFLPDEALLQDACSRYEKFIHFTK